MDRLIRTVAGCLLTLLFALWAPSEAAAQRLRDRPVKFVVPYTTGGPADLATRILAESISPILGVPVVVENRPGATGKIAAEFVARAEPDGHTLLVTGTPQYIYLPLLEKSLSYKPFDDFRMVSIFMAYDIVFMTGAASGVKSMQQLAAKMRDPKDDVTFASIGQPHLTPPGLAFLVFERIAKGNARPIVYPGQAPGVIDLIAGRVTFATNTLAGNLPRIQGGQLVALAVSSERRLPQLPDTPTMAEAGFPEFMSANNWTSWVAVGAPAKTPDAIVDTINRAIVQAARSEAFVAKIEQQGLKVLATGTAAQDQAAWRAEYDRLEQTLKRFDIRMPDTK